MGEGALRIGCLLLRWDAAAPAARGNEIAVELEAAAERVPGWLADGGALAVQALQPVAGLPPAERRAWSLIAAGPGAALGALTAGALGLTEVAAVLHPDDAAPFAAAGARSPWVRWNACARLDELANGAHAHLALLGCGGTPPAPAALLPLVKHLRPEGLLVLFGLPAAGLRETFAELSARGLSLRGCGLRGEHAFVAGSLEHGHRLDA